LEDDVFFPLAIWILVLICWVFMLYFGCVSLWFGNVAGQVLDLFSDPEHWMGIHAGIV
jgi:hypothetical protein